MLIRLSAISIIKGIIKANHCLKPYKILFEDFATVRLKTCDQFSLQLVCTKKIYKERLLGIFMGLIHQINVYLKL